MSWTLVARDLLSGAALGELRNVSGRNLRLPFLRTPTLTGSVTADNPLFNLLLNLDTTIISAYDTSVQTAPLFQGPVVGYQKTRNSQGGVLSFTAAGNEWRLDHRLLGRSITGATFGTTAIAVMDRGQILKALIDALNRGESTNIFTRAANTGIRPGTISDSSNTYVGPLRYKVASELVNELTATLDGPDIRFRPVEPVLDSVGVQYTAMDVAAALGQLQSNIAFEYGTGSHNVAEWNDVGDANTLANDAFNLPQGFPDNAVDAPIEYEDSASQSTRGLYETVVSADMQTLDLRTKLIQNHIRVRKVPRRVISFTPIVEASSVSAANRRVPRLFADYRVGDVVTFRAVESFPVTNTLGSVIGTTAVKTVDVLVRVFSAELAIDDNGNAQTTLTLQADA